MTERQILEKIKELKKSVTIVENLTEEEIRLQTDRKKRWMTLWRNNPNLYLHYVLGLKMFPFEHHSLYEMGQSTTYDEVSTRGTAKIKIRRYKNERGLPRNKKLWKFDRRTKILFIRAL